MTVTNTGDYDGEETVQLYIRDVQSRITRPEMELRRFKKIFLKKGATETVVFELALPDLEYVLSDSSRVYDPGEFEVFTGGSSDRVKALRFVLTDR